LNIRTIVIKDKQITVSVRKSATAKHTKLQMHPIRGIELVIPKRHSFDIADSIIKDNINWIEQVHKKNNTLQNRFYFFGKIVTTEEYPELFSVPESSGLFDQEPKLNEKKYDIFLRKEANKYLINRIIELSEIHKFKFSQVKIRKLLSRWGSCTSKKVISLNYKLMKCDPEVIDYVIVHELCHTVEMNHSHKFWNLVAKIHPDYKELRQRLKSFYY